MMSQLSGTRHHIDEQLRGLQGSEDEDEEEEEESVRDRHHRNIQTRIDAEMAKNESSKSLNEEKQQEHHHHEDDDEGSQYESEGEDISVGNPNIQQTTT